MGKTSAFVSGKQSSDTDTFFRDRASDGGAFHLTLRVYNNTSVILQDDHTLVIQWFSSWIETYLKVEEQAITTAPCFALTDNDDRHRCTCVKVGEKSPRQRQGGKKSDALFLRSSGFPFFTDATTMSPTPASGRRFRCEPKPKGSMRYSDFAPLLSAQLRTAPTGRPRVRRNLFPEDPAPVHTKENE